MKKKVAFRPSDTEVITQLLKFVAGKCLPDTIGFEDVYGKEPWELIGESCKKTHYFLIQLKKKKRTDGRFNRTTGGGGSWMQQDKGKAILHDDENLVIGYKRSLIYKHKKTPSLNGQWMMKEYFLADFLVRQLNSDEAKDFVICAVKKNPKSLIGNSTTIVSDDVAEYKRFIDSVLQETIPSEPDAMLVQDGFFGLENQESHSPENQESYPLGNEEELDWLSLLDFEDDALVQNCLLY